MVKLGKATLVGAALADVESPAEAVERLASAAALAELPLDIKAPGKTSPKPKGKTEAKKDKAPDPAPEPEDEPEEDEDFETILDEYDDLGFDEPDDLD